MSKTTPSTCLIVGAGLAGLTATRLLVQRGIAVTVIDKGRGVGGRMATRRMATATGQARFDHGAQYFTARSDRFRRLVAEWLAEGVALEWSRGFATPAGPKLDNIARYRGAGGMSAIPKHLAAAFDVRTATRISAVSAAANGWTATAEDGSTFTAESMILTPPVPQSLALLNAGGVALPTAALSALRRIEYAPCFAVLAVLDGPSGLPSPGGLWPNQGNIAWLADNQQKGISSLPAVTIHATPAFTTARFDDDQEEVARTLLAEAAPFLKARPTAFQVQRWRYALPTVLHDAPLLRVDEGAPLIFAGDAFAGPRVEGAALSGLAAAHSLLGSAPARSQDE